MSRENPQISRGSFLTLFGAARRQTVTPEFKRKMESKDPFEFRAFKSYLEETSESTEVHLTP